MKRFLQACIPLADVLLAPAVYPAAWLLRVIRQAGLRHMPFCRRALMRVGVLPVRNHYHEPFCDSNLLTHRLDAERTLPGIDWNLSGQLELLAQLACAEELREMDFRFDNGAFESGDAEYWYQLVRLKKASLLIEIGAGHSTVLAAQALRKNREQDAGYAYRHVCIEPYEAPWLENTGASVIRRRLEEVDRSLFLELGPGDILFIDSSHVIRPQGDVVVEFLELLPSLRPGVIVHVHDIFSPRDYPRQWVLEDALLWDEQYLLEAFLTNNTHWKIVGALNYLHHNHYARLRERCPYLVPEREPGSFYIEKIA